VLDIVDSCLLRHSRATTMDRVVTASTEAVGITATRAAAPIGERAAGRLAALNTGHLALHVLQTKPVRRVHPAVCVLIRTRVTVARTARVAPTRFTRFGGTNARCADMTETVQMGTYAEVVLVEDLVSRGPPSRVLQTCRPGAIARARAPSTWCA